MSFGRGEKRLVVVHRGVETPASVLRAAGGRRAWLDWLLRSATWSFRAENEASLAQLLGWLRDAGFAFSYDYKSVSPEAIFKNFRDRGLVVGPYREIYWVGPGEWRIAEH